MAAEGWTATAAVEACLAAIERDNGIVNAMMTVTADQALAEAAAVDRAAAEGAWLGLLHGLPMAIKDNIDTAGVRTTAGSLHFKDVVPNNDAEVVTRLRRAGAVLVGKAAMHELAFGIRSVNPVSGQCRNPWDSSRVPGGSSGGSGAAVASGMCHAALGSDTGGSVRLPAAMNGVAGLRPTHGRVSNQGSTPVSASFDTIGPLARRVTDVARIFAVLARDHDDDPKQQMPVLGNFLPRLDDGIAGLRIGVPRNHYFDDLDPDVAAAVEAAMAVLEHLGAALIDIDVPGAAETHQWATIFVFADACAYHAERLDRNPELFSEDVYARMIVGRDFSAVDYAAATRAREAWRQTLGQVFQEVDIMLSPATPNPPPPIADDRSLLEATRAASRNTYAGGLGSIPGLSVPCGFDRDGLPVGLQLESAWWQESVLFKAGVAYQSVTEWHLAVPPHHPS